MVETSLRVKIPHDRVGVLIGPGGNVKQRIEKACAVKLNIDSASGDVEVVLNPDNADPTTIFKAQNIITAIGRGFSPEKATRLLDGNVMFEIIDLRDYAGRSPAELRRIKGRIIGEKGKTRRILEETTNANISIYGHTVSVIGDLEQFEAAKQAIKMLIRGSQHSTVYRFLHRKRRELKKAKLVLWETPMEG